MRKILGFVGLLMVLSAIAIATQPTFTFNRYVDYGPHAVAGNCMGAATRANGGVLFCDGYDDWVIQVATPLTTDGSTNDGANSLGVYQAIEGTTYYFSGGTYQGICYDGTNYFASGVSLTTSCVLIKLTDATPYVGVKLTVSPDGPYSGVTAVSAGNIVMPNYDTGALQFFTVSGATATANGTAIANPNVSTFKTTQAYFYNDGNNKWILTYMVDTVKTRRIDVFQTDGTPGGTTYRGTFCDSITTNYVVDNIRGVKYCNLAIHPGRKVLVAAAAIDSAGNNGFDVFDINAITYGGTATPYLQIRDVNFTGGTNHLTTGAAFFNSASVDYVAFTGANRMNVYTVETASGEENWFIY